MVRKPVEKIQKTGKGTEKELLYFLFTTDSNIFAQTLQHQVKKQRNLSLVDSGQHNECFRYFRILCYFNSLLLKVLKAFFSLIY